MKRLARLAVVAGLITALVIPVGQAALATPFSDVPANHWAYEYIQSLAADGVIDGYPDGKFKGDRPLTRYEMAVVVARVIAKLQENQGPKGPSREDLDKLQKLIDSLKDELDALGVRVTNLEDSLDALDKRTKFAQSLSMHGVFLPNVTLRERPLSETTITNTTAAAVTTYYGTAVPCSPGVGGCAAAAPGTIANPTAVGGPDPFVNAFLSTDDSNNPFTQASSGIQIRQDSRFSLAYQISDNLTISLPVHILNFEYGGDFSQQAKVDIEPGVDINIAHAGALSNLDFKFGEIDNMTSSRFGLAFRAPQGYNGNVPYEQPVQPFQKGVAVKGTIGEGAFGLTDFETSFTRMDDVRYDTQTGVTDPSTTPLNSNAYFFPIVAPQETFTQTTPAGALRTDTFNAGSGPLAQVYLSQKAVDGTVYISYYDGATYSSTGTQTGGGTAIPVPGFTYNDAYNAVIFSSPLPAGSVVIISYKNISTSNNSSFQRYMVHARANQKFKGYTGAEVGLTFNRIFDYDDTETVGSGATGLTLVNQTSADGYGLVSDTVFGVDFQAPLPIVILGPGSGPVIFGEFADSKFTPDYRNISAVGDTAGLVGLKLTVSKVLLTAQYQSVGQDFFVGAPFRYFGNAPALFSSYRGGYFPDFFGFGNDVGINQQYDGQFTSIGAESPNTSGNPNLTFAYPIFNPLKAQSPTYFSAFAPNTRGESLSANAPIRLGELTFTTTGTFQHLEEIRPNSIGAALYGPAFASNTTEKYDTYGLNTKFAVPVFGTHATVNLNGQYETLKRLDTTAQQYYPINPGTGVADAAAFAAAAGAFPTGGTFGSGSQVSFYPNYVNVRHITIGANATLPLTKDLNLNGSYSTQRYGGSDGTTITQNISERKDYYTGGLTYNIPKTNSSLSFLARHYSYTDDVVQNFNFGQNRQDINFTVRF
jgi:S-layer homology domain